LLSFQPAGEKREETKQSIQPSSSSMRYATCKLLLSHATLALEKLA